MTAEQKPFRMFNDYYYKWDKLAMGNVLVHSHLHYEIYYLHEGRCDYTLGDRTIPLQAGDLLIMNGLTPHRPEVDRSQRYVRTMFSFDPYRIQSLGNLFLTCNPLKPFEVLRNHHVRLTPSQQDEMETILARLNRFYYKEDTVLQNRMLASLYDLLLFIYEHCREEMESSQNALVGWERYVKQMIVYIEENYMKDIEIEQMAADLHMNRFHLMKVFREVTGMTVFDYLYQRRIDQAKLLFLHQDPESVMEIGFRVGFKHPSHFSRVFKKKVGLSPDQFRRKVRASV